MKLVRTLCASALLVITVTSCVAPAKVSDDKDANGKKIEYVYYTPSGSNIPIKVRKDSLNLSDSDAAAQDKAYSDLQRDSVVKPPPTPGGK
jgi:hypothetical protein